MLRAALSDRESAAATGLDRSGGLRPRRGLRAPADRAHDERHRSSPATAGSLEDLLADTGEGLYLETNRSWSIDDRRWHFQFATEVAREIRGGELGRLYRNPSYAGHHAALLGLARRRRRPAGLARLGPDELRQGRAGPGHGRVARRGAGALPRRPGGRGVSAGEPALELAERALAHAGGGDGAQATVVRERSLLSRFARSRPTQATRVDDTSVVAAARARRPPRRRPRPTTSPTTACAPWPARRRRRPRGGDGRRRARRPSGAARPRSRPRPRGLRPRDRRAGSRAGGPRAGRGVRGLRRATAWRRSACGRPGTSRRRSPRAPGVRARDQVTDAYLKVIARDERGRSGWAAATAVAAGAIDPGAVARRAAGEGQRAGARRSWGRASTPSCSSPTPSGRCSTSSAGWASTAWPTPRAAAR